MDYPDTIFDVIETASERVETILKTMKKACGEKECGLDERAGTVWVDEECVVVRTGNRQRLEYCGGFEYVKCTPIGLGKYTVYFAHDDSSGRVQDVIDRVFDREENED